MQWKEFIPFLLGFIALMYLLKYYPKGPWIIIVSVVGIVYGMIMKNLVEDQSTTPRMLRDLYPTMATKTVLW